MVEIILVLTAIVVMWLGWRARKAWREVHRVEQEAMPDHVREAGHKASNDIQAFRGGLQRINQAEDPIAEFVRVISENRSRDELRRIS